MSTTGFSSIYNSLNATQKQAVDTIDGPVMVLAGPGTGKTQVLSARIAHILQKTDTNPSSILALTFTESAAKNMRQRLVSMIGKTGYYVRINTFHGFCTEVINSHPEFFPIDRDSQPLTDLERFDVLQTLIDELPLKVLRPLNARYLYLKEIIKVISDLKREHISPTKFGELVTAESEWFEKEAEELSKAEVTKYQKKIAKNQELLLVYEAYQQRIRDSARYDFDDMIALVVEALEQQPDLLTEYQEQLLYFLVDEYQDTNASQNKVVDLLASFWGEEANVFVVGDPNQSIYRFQGASLENILSFSKRYTQTRVITLDTGYRSTQTLYNAASALINNNQLQLPDELKSSLTMTLKSVRDAGQHLSLFVAPSQTLEVIYVAEAIQKLLEKNVKPEEIAILYRNNADALEMAATLDKWGIEYEIDGGNNVLDNEYIIQLLDLFRVIHQVKTGQEDGLVFRVLQYEWMNLDSLLIMKATRAAAKAKCSIVEMIQQGFTFFEQHHLTTDVNASDFAQLEVVIKKFADWATQDARLTFPAWFELVITDSGFLPWVMAQGHQTDLLNHVNSLFREIKGMAGSKRQFGLNEFLEIIETLERHGLSITLEDLNISQGAVKLSTVHKAKGQEWTHVFIIRCVDGKWGNSSKRELIALPDGILRYSDTSQKERNEDERRLFYVALTRARDTLTITYPETIITDNRSKGVVGSLFVEEVKDFLQPVTDEVAQGVIEKADEHLQKLLERAVVKTTTDAEQKFFEHLVKDFKLSATALNVYLRSPADFINRFLLKVPTAKSPALAFGSAVHRSLEEWWRLFQQTHDYPSLETVLASFEQALGKEPLSATDFQERLEHGREVLANYYTYAIQEKVEPIFIERFFGAGWTRALLDDVVLTGIIDRVDLLDKDKKTVTIIDYKTGSPLTLGEIEGKTVSAGLSERERSLPESIRGPYKRQLLFYKLLTQLDRSFGYTTSIGRFEFIEPDKQSGKRIIREIPLKDEEVNDLKKLIKEVMAEIRALQFLETT